MCIKEVEYIENTLVSLYYSLSLNIDKLKDISTLEFSFIYKLLLSLVNKELELG